MDMNLAARQLLAACADGSEVPGGLAFREALRQARLDGSLESLDRIDQALAQIRAKAKPTREAWAQRTAAENFLLALAFYLGETVAHHAGVAIDWMSYAQAQERLPPEVRPPPEPWSRVLGIVGDSLCVPLGAVEEAVFGNGAVQVGCRGYVQRMLERVAPGDPTDEEAMSRYFLRALAAGGTVRGGLAFSEALPQCGLDFSIESLGRLDALLAQIRAQLQPDYAGFVNQPDGQNFLRCVGYYTGTAIARSCGLSLRWLAYEPLKAQFPELPRQLETAFGCVIDDRIYFPLGIATEMLFDPEPRRSLLGLASQIQQKVAAPG